MSKFTDNESFLDEYNHTVESLQTIAKLGKGNKLYIDADSIYIDNRYFQGLYRWLYSVSRRDSLDYIDSLLNKIKAYIVNFKLQISSIRQRSKNKNKHKHTRKTTRKATLREYMRILMDESKLAAIGLSHLLEIYKKDNPTHITITTYINEFNNLN